jgi:hypothetical protein
MANGLLGNGSSYMNPDIPPEVVKLLAEMGYAPDGTKLEQGGLGSAFDGLSTQQRLDGLNSRISADWQQMGFNPPPPPQSPEMEENIFIGANSPMADTGPDPFGQETRARLDGINRRIDADMAAMEAPPEAPRNPVGGMSYTPALPPPPPVAPPAPPPVADVPKPKPRPKPTTYVVRAGDNPTKIARKLGLTLRQLEELNPGILKNARRLKIGSSLKV